MYSSVHCSIIYDSQDLEATQTSIDRWMGEEVVVVHIHNEILHSYKKECLSVGSNERNEPRAYYTEWSKSERERQIVYIDAYIWNLERWYWWSYMHGSKGDLDIKNRLRIVAGEGEGGMTWESHIETYTYQCKIDSQWEFAVWCREPKAGDLWLSRGVGWGGRWEGGFTGRGHMYTCGWLMSMYSRSHQNSIK